MRNQGDQMVYQTEKALDDMKDKISASDKSEIETALGKLKTALSGSDTAAIKRETEALTQVFYKVSERFYAQANPQAGPQGEPQAQPGGPNGQQYYDADYTVIDDDK